MPDNRQLDSYLREWEDYRDKSTFMKYLTSEGISNKLNDLNQKLSESLMEVMVRFVLGLYSRQPLMANQMALQLDSTYTLSSLRTEQVVYLCMFLSLRYLKGIASRLRRIQTAY
jgi:hypothetical protein